MSEEVIIVGAGVAGLSLAIMLAQRNIASRVLESRGRFDGPTSGVRISAIGVEILNLMNVDSVGEDTRRVDMHFGGLSASFSAPRRHDTSAVIVTRLALHERLMKRARALGIDVMTGFEVATVAESRDGVEAISESNERVTGTLLVGADGVGSMVRRMLNPSRSSMKTYAGYLGVGVVFQDETKIEMTLHTYPGHKVGIASCGRVHEEAASKSVFMWTHIRMSEEDAKLATRASVEAELARRAARWRPELRRKYDLYTRDTGARLAHGPVYNGKPPARWYGERTMLIGDAAHPYGPGGQGISMALKDAKALRDVIARGFTEDDKKELQRARAEESRALGEAAEKRNAKDASSTWGVLAQGFAVKAVQILTRGTLSF